MLSSIFLELQALITSFRASSRFRFVIWSFLPLCKILFFDFPNVLIFLVNSLLIIPRKRDYLKLENFVANFFVFEVYNFCESGAVQL